MRKNEPNRTGSKWRPARLALLTLLGFLLLNQLIFSAVVPFIFFFPSFSKSDYQNLLADPSSVSVTIETENGTLCGWQNGNCSSRVLLYFGGDRADSNSWLNKVREVTGGSCFPETTLLAVDYPSFGNSTGTISENTFYKAAENVYDYARERYPSASIYVMGYSIGSAAALHLSSCRDITGLLLIAPMYDGTSLYLPRESILHALLEKTATVQMQNDEFAPLCSVPVLIIASHTDRMTREEDISALSDLFSDPPSMVFLDDCAHGDFWNESITYEAIKAFLERKGGDTV